MNQRKAGAMLSYVYLALTFAVGIFYTPLILHWLGDSEYGVYSVASSIISFLAILDLGFNQTMIRYVAKAKAEKKEDEIDKLNGMFLIFYSIIAVIALIAGLIITLFIEDIFQKGFTPHESETLTIIFRILLVNLVVSFPLATFSAVINANEGFFFLKLTNIISFILTYGGILLSLYLGNKSISMALITAVVGVSLKIITAIYGTKKYKIRFRFSGFDKALLREIFIFSFFIFLNIVIDQLYASTDKFILGALCSSAIVTTYTVGVQFSSYFEQFSTSISGVFLPKITQLVTKDGDMKNVSELFIRIGRIQFIILSFLMSAFIIFGQNFISLWVGDKQLDAYRIALVVIIPAIIPLSQNLGISVLRAMNKHHFRSIIYFFLAIMNVALSIPMAIKFGGFGAAAATGISTCCGQIIAMNWFYYKKIGINIPGYWKEVTKIAAITVLIGLIGYGIHIIPIWQNPSLTAPLHGWISFIIQCIIYAIAYFIIGWVAIFNEYEKELVDGILRKIFRHKS
ncbi:lipopolysaccharide biosynthesis protein [Eubacterium xylanophilum]|uniref:lipopolysaccharide biosynthesis protein n=1 Tax=Eubacterium xylanophilum TaxID=39497 RepID=UPI0004B74307|nr:oligosaccharide flippase family protein [Eubacterium xylanophilum]